MSLEHAVTLSQLAEAELENVLRLSNKDASSLRQKAKESHPFAIELLNKYHEKQTIDLSVYLMKFFSNFTDESSVNKLCKMYSEIYKTTEDEMRKLFIERTTRWFTMKHIPFDNLDLHVLFCPEGQEPYSP